MLTDDDLVQELRTAVDVRLADLAPRPDLTAQLRSARHQRRRLAALAAVASAAAVALIVGMTASALDRSGGSLTTAASSSSANAVVVDGWVLPVPDGLVVLRAAAPLPNPPAGVRAASALMAQRTTKDGGGSAFGTTLSFSVGTGLVESPDEAGSRPGVRRLTVNDAPATLQADGGETILTWWPERDTSLQLLSNGLPESRLVELAETVVDRRSR